MRRVWSSPATSASRSARRWARLVVGGPSGDSLSASRPEGLAAEGALLGAQAHRGPAQQAHEMELLVGGVVDQPGLEQRLAPQHGVGAAEEGRVPAVLALLDGAVEQRRLAAEGIARGHVAEPLRGLHEGDAGVAEVAEGAVQDVRVRDLVRVLDEDELAVGLEERVVEVAGLGVALVAVPVVGADDVAGALLGGHPAHLLGLAVVQHVGAVRVADGEGGADGLADDVDRLVVGGDEDVDPLVAARGRRRAAAAPLPHGRAEEQGVDEREGLRGQQQKGERPERPVDRRGVAPEQVVRPERRRGDDQQPHQRLPEQEPGALALGVAKGRPSLPLGAAGGEIERDGHQRPSRPVRPGAEAVDGRSVAGANARCCPCACPNRTRTDVAAVASAIPPLTPTPWTP